MNGRNHLAGALAADGLGNKGFIQSDHINVGQCHARLLKHPFHRRYRSLPHVSRIKAAGGKTFFPRPKLP